MKVAGRVVVVTGGGNGIGRQLVLELLRRGASVAAVDLREESLAETVELAGVNARLATFALDITDRDGVRALPERVAEALGPADAIINNAGIIQPFVRVAELEDDVIDRVLAVNLRATIDMVRAFLPTLQQRPTAHITNVASMGAFLPVPGQAIYGASKAGVMLLTEALFAELTGTRIGVTVVLPGGVGTDITTNSGVDAPTGSDPDAAQDYPTTAPEDAARTILDGMEEDKLHVFVGRDAVAMNLLRRVAPKRAISVITRQMKDLLG